MTRSELALMCRRYSHLLFGCPRSLDPAQVLWALAGNESSFGANVVPRHEPGYCRGGRYFIRDLDKRFGCWAHCSYGPLQVMFPNALAIGMYMEWAPTPTTLASNHEAAIEVAARLLSREVFGRQKATTLEQIGDAWNSGNCRDSVFPTVYCARLAKNYLVPMPPDSLSDLKTAPG